MTIWNQVRSNLRNWLFREKTRTKVNPEQHLLEANRNIRELIEDTDIPSSVRAELSSEFEEIASISDKLRNGEIHIAVFGRVSTGKSSLLNALIGESRFAVSPLHGETKVTSMQQWSEVEVAGVYLIDTPGLDEAGGEHREEHGRRQRDDVEDAERDHAAEDA